MKTIKIKFDGFPESEKEFIRIKSVILDILKKHYTVILANDPDYIFYSLAGDEYYKFDGIRIFVTIEAICPDFNLCDYGIGFEKIVYGDRYLYFPNYLFDKVITEKMADKHKDVDDGLTNRDFCSFVYSNDAADPMRKWLYDIMTAYQKVDSGGKYLNNLSSGQPVVDKFIFEKAHKFSIACENAAHLGYHTEKLAEAFAAQTIPIYWGDPIIDEYFNKDSFINVNDYSSLDAVVEKVKKLNENDEDYLQMLRQPALAAASGHEYVLEMMQTLEKYITHIIDQPLEQAYRRNRGFWGKQYTNQYRSDKKVLDRYLKFRSSLLGVFLRKLKKIWARS